MCLVCEVAINKESARELKTVDYSSMTNGYNSGPAPTSYSPRSDYSKESSY